MVDWLWKAKTVKKLSCIRVWEKEGNGNNTFCFRIHGHRGSTQASEVEARIYHQMQRDSSCSCSISLTLFSSHKALERHTHRFLHQQLLFLFHKSHELDQYNMIFFCFYPVLATTNKRKTCTGTTTTDMRKNNSTGTTRKSTQLWWSRIGHIIRMKSLDTCVCVRARVYLSNAWEKCHQKKKKTAEKNLQEQSVRTKKKRKKISERKISEREIHFTIHIRERRSTQAVWWHGRMRYRNWRDPARSSFLQTPRISPEGRKMAYLECREMMITRKITKNLVVHGPCVRDNIRF